MIEELVEIKISKRAKRVALRLDPIKRVINLIVPENMPIEKAYFFAQSHEKWVQQTLNKLASPIKFENNTVIPIFGDDVVIKIEQDTNIKCTTIKQYDDMLLIKSYMKSPSNRIKNHLKKLAHKGLSEIATEKSEMIGKKISSISIKDTKSRWGSCSENGNISFSWRLIFAPYEAMDYVVAHEIAHLIHMNHSKDFWELCQNLSLNFFEGKYWMQNHGNELMRYG